MPSDPPDIDSLIRDTKALRARRRAAQAREPIIEVIGLVDPSGAGRSQWAGDPEWTFSASLVAWRLPGGPVQRTPVRLERPADDEAYEALRHAFDPYDLVRVRVRMPAPEPDGGRQAYLEALVATIVDDDELEAFAIALQAPVVFRDPLLGELTLDRGLSWFSGEIAWSGTVVEVSLPADENDKPLALPDARAVVVALGEWDAKARRQIGDDLFELYNDTWRDEDRDRSAISLATFDARLRLSGIDLQEEGGLIFWYDADEMFTDHIIEVRGSLASGFTEAGIAG